MGRAALLHCANQWPLSLSPCPPSPVPSPWFPCPSSLSPSETFAQYGTMPLPKELLEDMARRYESKAVLAERDKLWDHVRTALTCFIWAALGIACILWSAHTTSLVYGRIAFFGGLGVGNAGIIFTLLAAYRRGEKRGDW